MPVSPELTEFYVATTGRADANGSFARPWDLATALRQPRAVKPGAVIWLRGGVYSGSFVSTLKGTATAPIIVRNYQQERVTLDYRSTTSGDSPLIVKSAWAWYWGLEITNSAPLRVTDQPGTYPSDLVRAMGVNVRGPNNKFINMIVHDAGISGIGFWREAQDSEVYGSIIYNNGWQGPDRGHGHAIYGQNDIGTKRIVDNIVFNQFSHGLHIYASKNTKLTGFQIEGNIAFNNGTLSRAGSAPNILVGGENFISAEQITVTTNYTYQRAAAPNIRFDYPSGVNKDLTCVNNYFVGGDPVVSVGEWQRITMLGNTMYTLGGNEATLAQLNPGAVALSSQQWDKNVYVSEAPTATFRLEQRELTFPEWQAETAFDQNSQYRTVRPTGAYIVVQPNAYEPGRANIAVYNWDKQSSVAVDVSRVLQPGVRYEVHTVQDYFGAPVASGTYTGKPLQLPMEAVPGPQPVGTGWATPPATGPAFNAFVLTSTAPPQ